MDMNRYNVTNLEDMELVARLENHFKKYMALPFDFYALVISLWTIATHCFQSFDSFPYLSITASTKQAGKTRLAELTSFACHEPFFTTNATAAAIYSRIGTIEEQERDEKPVIPPTLFNDEAEALSTGDAGSIRALLNSGYRKGQVIARMGRDYRTYCPKVFVLIGDVYDTLRDRCILFVLRRGTPPNRFVYSVAEQEGKDLREDILTALDSRREAIKQVFLNAPGLDFLADRDEEIWLPLFCICAVFCPSRFEELQRAAVDMCAVKTHARRRHVDLVQDEDKALQEQYSFRLLLDMNTVLSAHSHQSMPTEALIEALKSLPTAPWRKFRSDDGLTAKNLADMVARFEGVRPKLIRGAKIAKGQYGNVKRGYRQSDVQRAIEREQNAINAQKGA